MDDLMKDLGIGGGGGIIGLILSWFGFKSQIKDLRTDLDGVKRRVRFRDTCDEIVKRVETILKNIEVRLDSNQAMQEEMRNDIKQLISRKK